MGRRVVDGRSVVGGLLVAMISGGPVVVKLNDKMIKLSTVESRHIVTVL